MMYAVVILFNFIEAGHIQYAFRSMKPQKIELIL